MNVAARLRGVSASSPSSTHSRNVVPQMYGRKTPSSNSVVNNTPLTPSVIPVGQQSRGNTFNSGTFHNTNGSKPSTPSRTRPAEFSAPSDRSPISTYGAVEEEEPPNETWSQPTTFVTQQPQQQTPVLTLSSQQQKNGSVVGTQKAKPKPQTPVQKKAQGKDVESEYVQGLDQQLGLLDLETQYNQFNLGNKDVELEASLVRHMKALRERCAIAVKTHKEQREEMEVQVEDAKRRCVYMEKTISQLKQDINDANGRVVETQRVCSEDKTKLMTDSVRLQKEVDKQKKTIDRYQHEQEDSIRQIKELRTALIEKEQEVSQLSQKLEDAEKENGDLAEQLTGWQQKSVQQAQQLELLQAAPPEDLKTALETLKTQKQEADLLIQQKTLALVQAEQVREHAILQCNAAMQRETQHLASVKRLQAEFNKESLKVATMQKQISEAQDKAQDSLRLQHELSYSQQRLSQATILLDQTRKQLSGSTAEVKRLQDEREQILEEMNLKDQENEELDSANTDLSARLQETSEQLQQMMEKCTQLETREEELRDSLCKADAHAEVMKRKWALASELDARLNTHEIMVLKDSAAQMTVTLDSLARKLGKVEEPDVQHPNSSVSTSKLGNSKVNISAQEQQEPHASPRKTSPRTQTTNISHSATTPVTSYEEDLNENDFVDKSPSTTPRSVNLSPRSVNFPLP